MTTARVRLFAALLPLIVAGCKVEDNQSLTLQHFVGFTTTGMCIADPLATLLATSGVFDASLIASFGDGATHGYLVAPVIQNNIPDRAGGGVTVQRDGITVNSFEIELHDSKGGDLPFQLQAFENMPASTHPAFTVNSAVGVLAPTGKAAVFVDAIPTRAAQHLAKADFGTWDRIILVHIRAVGDHSGNTLKSNWVDFPVTICKGCLTDEVPCDQFDSTVVVRKGGCYVGQDDVMTCCTQRGGGALCGPDLPTPVSLDGGTPYDAAMTGN